MLVRAACGDGCWCCVVGGGGRWWWWVVVFALKIIICSYSFLGIRSCSFPLPCRPHILLISLLFPSASHSIPLPPLGLPSFTSLRPYPLILRPASLLPLFSLSIESFSSLHISLSSISLASFLPCRPSRPRVLVLCASLSALLPVSLPPDDLSTVHPDGFLFTSFLFLFYFEKLLADLERLS